MDGLQSDCDDLRETVSSLRERLVDSRLADLRDDAIEVDGQRWLVGTVAGLDANALADRAESAVGDDVDVAALVDADGQYLGVGTTGGVDAGEVVDQVTTSSVAAVAGDRQSLRAGDSVPTGTKSSRSSGTSQ